MSLEEREREIRLLLEEGTLFLDLCEGGEPAFRIPMTPDDAMSLARALVIAVRYFAEPATTKETVS
jgi:hypothetical protein